jgi:succinate dehydrogenase/fumarate reductase flavoprotein subunit
MIRPGSRAVRHFVADGYLTIAPTLSELAVRLGIDSVRLEATAANMNRWAMSGVDTEFGRGTTPYHHINGDADNRPNPNLGPIRTPPFYSIRLFPGDIGAAVGLATDAAAQLLDHQGLPIHGLYACGNDMNSIMNGAYPAPGITLGPALVFAYIAVAHAASVEVD